MKNKPQSLQDPFLAALQRDQITVSVYLVNGVRLVGRIESFDPFVVEVRSTSSQLVFKHAISTIAPERRVDLVPKADESEGQIKDVPVNKRVRAPTVIVKRLKSRVLP